ncbi:hypothetical protein Tco_1477410 [Tanacetum coccineum]
MLHRKPAQSKAHIDWFLEDDVGTLWFHKLRLFLDKQSSFKVLKLHVNTLGLIDVKKLEMLQLPPYELEHVELEVDTEELAVCEDVVDVVLWCCRPQSLTIRSNILLIDSKDCSDVINYTYERLLTTTIMSFPSDMSGHSPTTCRWG